MHLFKKRIDNLEIMISAPGDWNGDADICVTTLETSGAGELRVVDQMDFPPVDARALLAGRFEPRCDPTWGPRILSLRIWGAVVAAATAHDVSCRAVAAIEAFR